MCYSELRATLTARKCKHVARHLGTAEDFLNRYESLVAELLARRPPKIRRLRRYLLPWIGDCRNLFVAWSHGAVQGGAPGPNGWRYQDFSKQETYRLLALISEDLLHHGYSPGPIRHAQIPKKPGGKTRPIRIPNIEDKAVQRGVVQIVQPLLDPTFDDRSYCRPGRGPWHGLAQAEALVRVERRTVWITADVFHAFEEIPHPRLLEILRKRLPAPDVVELIERMIANTQNKGLDQGSSLSPFLANLFLDHFVDRRWRKLHPLVPLLRYMDDLLVVCGPDDDPSPLYQDLQRIVREAGLRLNAKVGTGICDISQGVGAQWLGYCISSDERGLIVTLTTSAHRSDWVTRLRTNLARAQTLTQSPLRAIRMIRSFLDHAAPCYPFMEHQAVYEQVRQVACEMGFEEVPELVDFVSVWRQTHKRWRSLLASMARGSERQAGSDRTPRPAASRSMRTRTWSSITSDQPILIVTDGSFLPHNKAGGWACIVSSSDHRRVIRSGPIRRTTNNRAELWAAIHGLETLAGRCQVRLRTDSEYVALGINERRLRWKQRGWRAGSRRHNRPLKNADLWQKLEQLLGQHDVVCDWTPAHAGCPANELCDRLARKAAMRV